MQADKNCVALNGPGYSFNPLNCSCQFNIVYPQVQIRFRGCTIYLYLDTDTNKPTDDLANGIPKNSTAGDGDPCNTAFNVDYRLRRGSSTGVFFNIYPVPGENNTVIYIQGADRRTACLDRSFLQWTE